MLVLLACTLLQTLGASAFVTGNCSAGRAPEAIRLGAVLPLLNPTNNVTSVGVSRSMHVWEAYMNRLLRDNGLPLINMTDYAHTGGPSSAFKAAFGMVDQDPGKEISVMFGGLTGDDTIAMSYVSTFSEIPHFDTGATSGALSDKVKFPFFIRGTQSAAKFGPVWAEAFKAMGIKQASVLREDTAYGDSYEGFVNRASQLGIEIRTIQRIPPFAGATLTNGSANLDIYRNAWRAINASEARFVITFVGTVNLVRTLHVGRQMGLIGRGVNRGFILCGLSRNEWAVNFATRVAEVRRANMTLSDPRSLTPLASPTAASWGLPVNSTMADILDAAHGNLNMGNTIDWANTTLRDEYNALHAQMYPGAFPSFASPLLADVFITIGEAMKAMKRDNVLCQLNGISRNGRTFLRYLTAVNVTGGIGRITYDENYDRLSLITLEHVEADSSRNLSTSLPIVVFNAYLLIQNKTNSSLTNFYQFNTSGALLTSEELKRVFETKVNWASGVGAIPFDGSVTPKLLGAGGDDDVPVAAIAVPIAVGVPLILTMFIVIIFLIFFKKEKPRTLQEGDPDDVNLEALAAEAPNYMIHHGLYRGLRVSVQTYVIKGEMHGKSHREDNRSDYMTHSSGKESSIPVHHAGSFSNLAMGTEDSKVQHSMTVTEAASKKSSPKQSVGQKLSLLMGRGEGKSKGNSAKLDSIPDTSLLSWSSGTNPFEVAIRGLYNRLPLVNRMYDVKRISELLTILRSSNLVMATNIIDNNKVKLFLREHMQSGNLAELRQNQVFSLDDSEFRMKIILDVCRGILFLKSVTRGPEDEMNRRNSVDYSGDGSRHGSNQAPTTRRRRSLAGMPDPRGLGWRDLHGRIFPSNIFFDQAMGAKLGVDMGVPLASPIEVLTFSAPEVVTKSELSVASDVYSLGILIYDLFATKALHAEHNPTELVQLLAAGQLRPDINKLPSSTPEAIKDVIVSCTVHNPSMRPDPEMLLRELERVQMQVVADAVAKPSQAGKSRLDYGFPPDVKRAILEGRKVDPKPYECVTIFFSDIVSFTTITAQLGSEKTYNMLDRLYTAMDSITDDMKLFKAETIGDAFMAVGGLDFPPGGPDHTARVIKFACRAIKAAGEVLIDLERPELGCVKIRVGVNVGSIVTSVVGNLNPKWCCFGSTVNLASRMESTSVPGRIQLSEAAKDELLRQNPALEKFLEDRGMIDVKGNGRMHTFFFDHEAAGDFKTSADV